MKHKIKFHSLSSKNLWNTIAITEIDYTFWHERSPVNFCIFSEQLFIRAPLEDCFWVLDKRLTGRNKQWLEIMLDLIHNGWEKQKAISFSYLVTLNLE